MQKSLEDDPSIGHGLRRASPRQVLLERRVGSSTMVLENLRHSETMDTRSFCIGHHRLCLVDWSSLFLDQGPSAKLRLFPGLQRSLHGAGGLQVWIKAVIL
jgi:hypothetical protein